MYVSLAGRVSPFEFCRLWRFTDVDAYFGRVRVVMLRRQQVAYVYSLMETLQKRLEMAGATEQWADLHNQLQLFCLVFLSFCSCARLCLQFTSWGTFFTTTHRTLDGQWLPVGCLGFVHANRCCCVHGPCVRVLWCVTFRPSHQMYVQMSRVDGAIVIVLFETLIWYYLYY